MRALMEAERANWEHTIEVNGYFFYMEEAHTLPLYLFDGDIPRKIDLDEDMNGSDGDIQEEEYTLRDMIRDEGGINIDSDDHFIFTDDDLEEMAAVHTTLYGGGDNKIYKLQNTNAFIAYTTKDGEYVWFQKAADAIEYVWGSERADIIATKNSWVIENGLSEDDYALYQGIIDGQGYIADYDQYIEGEDFSDEELADLKRKFDDGWIFIGHLSAVTDQWTLEQIKEMEEDVKKAG